MHQLYDEIDDPGVLRTHENIEPLHKCRTMMHKASCSAYQRITDS